MKQKVSELTGVLLDQAVALAENLHVDGIRGDAVVVGVTPNRYVYLPSSKWAHGGPIVEREQIDIRWKRDVAEWEATLGYGNTFLQQRGPTPLVAAMRAFVASKFGEGIDL